MDEAFFPGRFASRGRRRLGWCVCLRSYFFPKRCSQARIDIGHCGNFRSNRHHPCQVLRKEGPTEPGLQMLVSYALEQVLVSFPSRLQGVFNRHHCRDLLSRIISLSDWYGGNDWFQQDLPVKALCYGCFGRDVAGGGRGVGFPANYFLPSPKERCFHWDHLIHSTKRYCLKWPWFSLSMR